MKKLLPKLLFWAFLVWIGYSADAISLWLSRLSHPASVAVAPPVETLSPASTKEPPRMFFPFSGYYADHCRPTLGINQRPSSLTIEAPTGNSHFCVVLVNASNHSERLCSIFVQAGDTVTVAVPDMELCIYFTSGSSSTGTWYGFDEYFGSTGSWYTSNDLFDFSDYTWTVTLDHVYNGNWDTNPVDAGKIPFLD